MKTKPHHKFNSHTQHTAVWHLRRLMQKHEIPYSDMFTLVFWILILQGAQWSFREIMAIFSKEEDDDGNR